MSRRTFLLLPLALSVLASQVERHFRPSEGNRFELIVEKTGLYKGKKHLFVFERYQGKLLFDAGRPENSQVEFTLESKSIVCKDTWVSAKDLKKVQEAALKDMLASDRYAAVSFRSNGVRASGQDRFEVAGLLQIRDVVKPATVSVTAVPGAAGEFAFEGHAVVRMTDYGLKPPSAALGLIGTKDEMTVTFRLRPEPAGK